MSPLAHVWESTLCAGAAAVFALVLRSAPAGVRHDLWLAASAKFLVPFSAMTALGASVGTWTAPHLLPQASAVIHWIDASVPAWALAVAAPTSSSALLRAEQTVALPLVLAWALGAMALIAWRCNQWRALTRAVRAAAPLTDGRVAAALARVQARSASRARVELRLCGSAYEPVVVGIRRPSLLWPDGLADRMTDEELEAILAHEHCHVMRRDNLRALVHVAVECVLWFHPVIWWIGARLVHEREGACDEEVMKMGTDRRHYAEAILKVCSYSLRAPAALAASVGGSDLSKRIARIVTGHAAPPTSLPMRVVLGSAMLCAVIAPLGAGVLNAHRSPVDASAPAESRARAGTTAQDDREVHRPGDAVTWPRLVHEVKPKYTPAALDAHIEAILTLEAIVLEDGTVGSVDVIEAVLWSGTAGERVKTSEPLDPVYGLQDEAVQALKGWRFEPGRKDGQPVAVLVPVEMSFTLK